MNLIKLSKVLQCVFEEGIADVIIYKKGRSWMYELYWEYVDEYDDIKKTLEKVKKIDKNYIVLNGYDNLAMYTLDYIREKIKFEYQYCKDGYVAYIDNKIVKL